MMCDAYKVICAVATFILQLKGDWACRSDMHFINQMSNPKPFPITTCRKIAQWNGLRTTLSHNTPVILIMVLSFFYEAQNELLCVSWKKANTTGSIQHDL